EFAAAFERLEPCLRLRFQMIPVFLGRAVRNPALRGLDDDLAQAISGRGGTQRGERLVGCAEPLLKRAQALACLPAFSVSGERLERRVGDGADDIVFEAALGPAEDFASLRRDERLPADQMNILVVVEAAERNTALGKCFEKVERRFIASAVTDMNAVLVEAAAERLLKQPADEPHFRLAFGDHGEARKECRRVVRAVPCDLRFVEAANLSGRVDIPEARFRGCRNGGRAVRRQEYLSACRPAASRSAAAGGKARGRAQLRRRW